MNKPNIAVLAGFLSVNCVSIFFWLGFVWFGDSTIAENGYVWMALGGVSILSGHAWWGFTSMRWIRWAFYYVPEEDWDTLLKKGYQAFLLEPFFSISTYFRVYLKGDKELLAKITEYQNDISQVEKVQLDFTSPDVFEYSARYEWYLGTIIVKCYVAGLSLFMIFLGEEVWYSAILLVLVIVLFPNYRYWKYWNKRGPVLSLEERGIWVGLDGDQKFFWENIDSVSLTIETLTLKMLDGETTDIDLRPIKINNMYLFRQRLSLFIDRFLKEDDEF